ncbi:hypothetical protein HDU86_005817 [Geranomyces michiganensis]|nr:hypothetical protein HDU86_005817 [Geranomyces michiganensis]
MSVNNDNIANLDLDQFLGVTQADLDLFATPLDSAIAAQDAAAWMAADNEMLDQLLLATPSESSVMPSPAFSTDHDPSMFSPMTQTADISDDAFFRAMTSPLDSVIMGDFPGSAQDQQYQESPMVALSVMESPPQFDVAAVKGDDQGWGLTDEGALFPALYSSPPSQARRANVITPVVPAQAPVAVQAKPSPRPRARPAAVAPKPIAPMPSSLLPLLNAIGPTAAQLALSPAALAAASAATGVDVKHLQQQLQAFAAMQARQTPSSLATPASNAAAAVAPPASTPVPAATSRKRKERPLDADALYAELDMKRQKNTEAARRSRQKKQERMAELEAQVSQLESERDTLKAEKDEGAVREMNYLAIISAMQAKLSKLSMYEGGSTAEDSHHPALRRQFLSKADFTLRQLDVLLAELQSSLVALRSSNDAPAAITAAAHHSTTIDELFEKLRPACVYMDEEAWILDVRW